MYYICNAFNYCNTQSKFILIYKLENQTLKINKTISNKKALIVRQGVKKTQYLTKILLIQN